MQTLGVDVMCSVIEMQCVSNNCTFFPMHNLEQIHVAKVYFCCPIKDNLFLFGYIV